MDATVFTLANNSSTVQEVDLFNTSDQGGAGLTEFVWNFKGDFADKNDGTGGPGPYVYNTATGLFYDQTILAANGQISIRLWDGTVGAPTTFTRTYTGAELQNLTKAQLLNFFNTNGNFSDIGTWYIDGPYGPEKGPASLFTIRVIPSTTFINANNILTDREFNYGVQSIVLEGEDGRMF